MRRRVHRAALHKVLNTIFVLTEHGVSVRFRVSACACCRRRAAHSRAHALLLSLYFMLLPDSREGYTTSSGPLATVSLRSFPEPFAGHGKKS